MLEETPHKLQIQVITPEENDEYGRLITGTGGESWQDVADCFCHDNSQQKEVSVMVNVGCTIIMWFTKGKDSLRKSREMLGF